VRVRKRVRARARVRVRPTAATAAELVSRTRRGKGQMPPPMFSVLRSGKVGWPLPVLLEPYSAEYS